MRTIAKQVNVARFQAVHFVEQRDKEKRNVVLLYALGEDGVIYEFSNRKWLALPITEDKIAQLDDPPFNGR